MANLKIVNINGKAVIETWDFLWMTCKDQAWMNNIEEARKWCSQYLKAGKADIVWDIFDEELQASVEQVVETPFIIEEIVVPSTVVTKVAIIEHLNSIHAEYSDRYLEYLKAALEIDDLEGAIRYTNTELYWVRKMEEGKVKSERKAVLNGFKKMVKKLVA